MILESVNFGDGTMRLIVDTMDCEFLARLCVQAEDASARRDNRIADAALLFTLAAVACAVYGATNSDAAAHGYLNAHIARCKTALDAPQDDDEP